MLQSFVVKYRKKQNLKYQSEYQLLPKDTHYVVHILIEALTKEIDLEKFKQKRSIKSYLLSKQYFLILRYDDVFMTWNDDYGYLQTFLAQLSSIKISKIPKKINKKKFLS